jgi:hypothetical protein
MALKPTGELESLTLRQLRGLRQEMAAILANQQRDRDLITRIDARMEQEFAKVDEGMVGLRRDIAAMRSDVVMLENGMLSRHNDILDLARRMDDPQADG